MRLITREDLSRLAEHTVTPCVTIYCPTFRAGKETLGNPVRFEQQLGVAEKQLRSRNVSSAQAGEILKEGRRLLEDDLFWQHQSDTLVLFLSPKLKEQYQLPVKIQEQARVGTRFYLNPLFPLHTNNGLFYLLAFSQQQVRLFRGTRFQIEELEAENLPKSLAQALRYDDPEEQLQFHGGSVHGGQQAPIYHGQGVGTDDQKDRLLRYFREIDKGAHDLLRNEKAPLVLAGVEYYFPIYRQVSKYPHLLEEGVAGNPEPLRAEELHEKAWPLVEPHYRQNEVEACDRFAALLGKQRASNELTQVLPAAVDGRVESLFVPSDQEVWGEYDRDQRSVTTHKSEEGKSEALLNLAAIETWTKGGTVYAVKSENMPGDSSRIAAIYRY